MNQAVVEHASTAGHTDVFVGVATLLLVVATIALVYVTRRIGQSQDGLAKNQFDLATENSRLAKEHNRNFVSLSSRMEKLTQRSNIIEIWDKMDALRDLDVMSPAPEQIIRNANTLQLLALCFEGGVIDEEFCNASFISRFVQLMKQIEAVPPLKAFGGRNGRQLLEENCKSAVRVFDKWKAGNLATLSVTGLGDQNGR